jgi:hypothetical protein
MNEPYNEVIQEVIKQAESDIILLIILLVVAMVVFILPLYGLIMKDRKEHRKSEVARRTEETNANNTRQDKYMERERQIIAVITANTEVMSRLNTTLERDGKATASSLERIHTRIDGQGNTLTDLGGAVIKLQTTLEEVVRNQQTISEDIKRGFSEVRKKKEE